jgi:hypothetical protein
MSQFDEFRVSLTPDLQTPGSWNVLLDECPVAALNGPKGTVQPTVTRDQLVRLRSRHGWPNLADLKTIGQSVWQSLMTPDLKAALFACLGQAQMTHRGLRLVFTIIGEEPEPAGPGQIRLQELPLEALYVDQLNFLAPNMKTPVSRSLKFKPDRDPVKLILPLRLLLVVATPNDKPPANMPAEQHAIQQALGGLTASGAVKLDFCEPATRAELTARLQQGYHIFHFIGHGAFETVDADPSPRPHLCLERPDGQSDPMDADTLAQLMLNTGVQLVVMTACSSANPVPEDKLYHARAFDGVAQRLMSDNSGVSAVVAMQFDLESQAAVTFSHTFYTNLLVSGRTLDEVVAMCRQALVGQMNAGHRSWVTPVVYWRCKNGQVFALEDMIGPLDPEVQKLLTELNAQIQVYLKNIAEVRKMPQAMQDFATPLVAKWQQTVDELQQRKSEALGDTLRLRGGQVKSGLVIQCRLTLRLRTPAQVGDVKARVLFPQDKVQFKSAASGASTPGINLMTAIPAPGELRLLVPNASQGAQWDPLEYELGLLSFQVQAGVMEPLVEIKVDQGKVERNGIETPLEALNAVLYVD